jgi:hypothetical protein
MTGSLYDETTKPFIEIHTSSVNAPTVKYKLLLGRHDSELLLLIDEGDEGEEGAPSTVIEAWLNAARVATDSLGKHYPEFDWSAIIGPIPSRIGEHRAGVDSEGLATPGNFGGLIFSSSGRHLLEVVPSPEMPLLSGGQGRGSIPIVVNGASCGHSWDNAAVSAARDLNRACRLLSVAWGVCMVIRVSPAPLDWGLRQVPERPLGTSADFAPQVPSNLVVDREIPSWAEAAWHIIGSRPRVADAIAAFHEGFKVENANPSLALVAFIASIEAISQVIFRDEKCSTCRAHKDIRTKFTETLRLVLSSDQADKLGAAYSSRSLTVHRGRLYGYESITGSMWTGIWSQNEQHEFMWAQVRPMREASRAILTLALKDELPPKKAFVPKNSTTNEH